ncbi:MAG TPA: hypothetical protein VE175_13275 [Woeseiaceae bacterium]|nr:hypothetical protein [Woeseiaceae bacterium]
MKKWISALVHPVILSLTVLVSCQESPQAISDDVSLEPAGGKTIVVSNSAELIAALSPENAGRRIRVRAGTYSIDQLLTVPDGVTLEGEGVMLFDGAGRPAGFTPGTRTTLSMTSNIPGNLLSLGDGVTVRGLEIADLAGRVGNVIAVVSRDAGDRVAATIVESEIINPNPNAGQAGHGLFVITRTLIQGADPPHEGAELTARLVRSVIRAPAGGGGLFAFNFASRGSVFVTLAGNVIGGVVIANGGVSLPDAVHDGEVRLESHRNLYRNDRADPCATPGPGWNLTGGSGPPFPIPVSGSARNTLRMHSVDDRVEGFTTGVLATGTRRFFPLGGPNMDNSIDLELLGSTISTPSCGGAPFVADLSLAGANTPFEALFPGDGNTLRAVIRSVTGSGPRLNRYTDASGPSGILPPELQGSGNRLEIVGSPQAFARTNRQINPPPPAEFFTSVSH